MTLPVLHQTSWAHSALGKPIELYSSRDKLGAERPLLFIGGVHGDEPEGVEIAQQLLSYLQKNNRSDFFPWLLIPCLNVDGFAKNERGNGHGVDLNRNFPSPDWSPESKAARYFPGPKANSEPEVQSLCHLIAAENPQAIFHFHSWEPCVVYTGRPGQSWAEVAATGSGYPCREDIGYPTPGSLGQYGWLVHQIPVICLEAQEKSDLRTVWPRFSKGLQSVLSRSLIQSKLEK